LLCIGRGEAGGLFDARLDKANAAGAPWSTQRRAYGGPAKVRRRARYPRTVDDLPNLIETCRRLLVGQKLALDDEYHYAHLPLCVIDSVFSIGVRYGGVKNVIHRYCSWAGIEKLRPSDVFPPRHQQQSVRRMLELYRPYKAEELAQKVFENRQRTSTRNGILKAEAVVLFGQALDRHGIQALQDVQGSTLRAVEQDVRRIPGQSSGTSWRYFLMLSGDETMVKPDRMILRFISRSLGRQVNESQAVELLRAAAAALAVGRPGLNARLLDNIIWKHERTHGDLPT